MIDVKKNLDDIVKKIEEAKKRAGRTDEVHLLAVSKTIAYDLIDESIEWGVRDIGENKVQDLLKRMDHYGDKLNYHFIGGLQRNKVKDIVGKVKLIHSVDSLRLAEEIDKRAKNAEVIQDCLLQVNAKNIVNHLVGKYNSYLNIIIISKQKKTHNSTVESWAIYFWFSYFHFDARFECYDEVVFIDCNALDYLPHKLIVIF